MQVSITHTALLQGIRSIPFVYQVLRKVLVMEKIAVWLSPTIALALEKYSDQTRIDKAFGNIPLKTTSICRPYRFGLRRIKTKHICTVMYLHLYNTIPFTPRATRSNTHRYKRLWLLSASQYEKKWNHNAHIHMGLKGYHGTKGPVGLYSEQFGKVFHHITVWVFNKSQINMVSSQNWKKSRKNWFVADFSVYNTLRAYSHLDSK